jgi:hypothetical protein
MNPNFEAAVATAREWLATTGLKRGQTVEPVEPTELLYVFGLEIEHEFDDHPFCGSRYIVDDLSLNCLCMEAERDKGAYDLLVRIAISKLLRNEPLTQQISLFAGLVLTAKRRRHRPKVSALQGLSSATFTSYSWRIISRGSMALISPGTMQRKSRSPSVMPLLSLAGSWAS